MRRDIKNIRQVVRGEYVATPVKNAFNGKISYWMSKRGCTLAIYMFTVETGESVEAFERRLSEEGFKEEIPRLEERLSYEELWAEYEALQDEYDKLEERRGDADEIQEELDECEEELENADRNLRHLDTKLRSWFFSIIRDTLVRKTLSPD